MNRKSLVDPRKTVSYLFTLAVFLVVLMANTGKTVQADGFLPPGPIPGFICEAPFGGVITCYPVSCLRNPLQGSCKTISFKSLNPGFPF